MSRFGLGARWERGFSSGVRAICGLVFTLSALCFSFQAHGELVCGQLADELESMRQANQTLITALVTNHELFASTGESFAEATLASSNRRTQISIVKTINESAQIFRKRGLGAKQTALKLDAATAILIEKLKKCLR